MNARWRASAEAPEIVDFRHAVSTEFDAAFDPMRPRVEFGMFEKQGRSMDRLARTMILTKRYRYSEDGAGVAAFLASAASDRLTRPLFMIDGGQAMQ